MIGYHRGRWVGVVKIFNPVYRENDMAEAGVVAVVVAVAGAGGGAVINSFLGEEFRRMRLTVPAGKASFRSGRRGCRGRSTHQFGYGRAVLPVLESAPQRHQFRCVGHGPDC